jgi:hypothetical protein
MADNGPRATTNLPLLSLATAVALVGLGVIALIFVPAGSASTPQLVIIIGLVATAVPACIAAAFAERTSRDVRNGVLVQQAKAGASQALIEHNVVTRDGPYVAATTQALLEILQARHGDSDDTAPEFPPLRSEDIP